MVKQILVFILFVMHLQGMKAGIVVLNGLSHSYKVEKGQVYKGTIDIENTGSSAQNVKIYFQDLSYTSDGNIYYTEVSTNKRSNSSWIKLNTNLLTLKAKEKSTIRYEIVVPEGISLPGSYWSVIIVEPIDEINVDATKPGVNITSIVRYAVQIITDIDSEKAKTDLTFESIKIQKQGNQRLLNVALANSGNLFCKPTTVVELYDKNGRKVGTFSSQTLGLLPGNSKMFLIDISQVPEGNYSAVILATDEDDNAFAINTELEVKHD